METFKPIDSPEYQPGYYFMEDVREPLYFACKVYKLESRLVEDWCCSERTYSLYALDNGSYFKSPMYKVYKLSELKFQMFWNMWAGTRI